MEPQKFNPSKFKVGDTLRCITTTYRTWTVGKDYKVVLKDDGGVALEADPPFKPQRSSLSTFIKVEKFEVGDEVQVVDGPEYLLQDYNKRTYVVEFMDFGCVWVSSPAGKLVFREVWTLKNLGKFRTWRDYTDEEKKDLLFAAHQGEEFQTRGALNTEWYDMSFKPDFTSRHLAYRVKPKEKEVVWGEWGLWQISKKDGSIGVQPSEGYREVETHDIPDSPMKVYRVRKLIS